MMRNELSGRSGVPDLLEAFGLPARKTDPKTQAWMKEVDEGYMKYFEELEQRMLREMGNR
jgi:hypothetical protein